MARDPTARLALMPEDGAPTAPPGRRRMPDCPSSQEGGLGWPSWQKEGTRLALLAEGGARLPLLAEMGLLGTTVDGRPAWSRI
jgi:hypothetical protein